MIEEQLREAIREKATDGRISCATLLKLAKSLGVPAIRLGRLCDEMNIRIRRCQLGCFE